MTTHAELLDGLVFPEGIRWHDGRLWFSDIHTGRVLAVDPDDGRVEVVAELDDDYPSGLGFLPDGSLLVAAIRTKTIRRVADGRVTVHSDLSGYGGDFINDMVTDADGRTYVGTRPAMGSAVVDGGDTVLLVHPDGRSEVAATGVTAPNGMVVTADGATYLVAETHAGVITAFDRLPGGRLGDRRTYATLPSGTPPDGICLGDHGAVWAATGFGGVCLHLDDRGRVTARVPALDGRWMLACVVGGRDRGTLFMATIETTMEGVATLDGPGSRGHADHDRWVRSLSAGWIEQVPLDLAEASAP